MDGVVEIDERLTRLENRIKSNFFEIEKKFADLETREKPAVDINESLHELEDLVLLVQLENTKLKESLGAQPAASGIPPGMEERLAALEQSSKQLSSQAVNDINAKISQLDAGVKALREESGRLTPQEVHENVSKINTARIELENSISRFRLLKEDVEKNMAQRKDMFSKLEQAEVDIEKASAYVAKMKATEEKVSAIAGRVESMDESIDAKLRANSERIELIKRDIDNRVAATDDKFRSRLEKLDATMEILDTRSRVIDEKMGELRAVEKDMADASAIKTGVEEQSLRMASLERNVSNITRHVSDIGKIKHDIEDELSIRASLEKKLEDIAASMAPLYKLDERLQEESALREGLESRLQDVKAELAGLRNIKGEVERAAGDGLEKIEEKINSYGVDEKVQNVSNAIEEIKSELESAVQQANTSTEEQLSAFDRKLEDIEQGIEASREPLIHARSEIEKAAQEKLEEFGRDAEELKQTLHLDEIMNIRNEIAEHRKVIQSLKTDLEVAAARFFTANLEEFAHALDKKFPGFVSREEYSRSLQEIAQHLKTIETPDLSPLASRVEMAEHKLEDIHELMANLARTMPIVVE